MRTLAKSLTAWIEPLACMFRYDRNNGIAEGFHRKMNYPLSLMENRQLILPGK